MKPNKTQHKRHEIIITVIQITFEAIIQKHNNYWQLLKQLGVKCWQLCLTMWTIIILVHWQHKHSLKSLSPTFMTFLRSFATNPNALKSSLSFSESISASEKAFESKQEFQVFAYNGNECNQCLSNAFQCYGLIAMERYSALNKNVLPFLLSFFLCIFFYLTIQSYAQHSIF